MGFEFASEIAESAENHIRRGSSQAAERTLTDMLGQGLNVIQGGGWQRCIVALSQVSDHGVEALEAFPAESAFAARFAAGEIQEIGGDVNHAVAFVKHNQTAGAHHRAVGGEGFIVDRQVEQSRGQAAAGRAADEYSLDLMAVFSAAADVFDNGANRRPHRHFDQAASTDFAGQGEGLGAGRGRSAMTSKGVAPLADDPGHAGESLDIVD